MAEAQYCELSVTTAFVAYITSYATACIIAAVFMYRERKSLILFRASYWRFLLTSWKLTTFAIAALSMTIMAPYTGDPTWDYVDASFMSVLTFLTAPWAVGTFYLGILRKAKPLHVYIAACVWMFSVSWLYDVYILLKDGYYPLT